MSGLAGVPTSALVRELAARAPSFVGRRLPARLRPAPPRRIDRTPFARFERKDRGPVELWAGYRNAVKSRWRGFFWPSRTLLELSRRADLDPPLAELADRIRTARTLPLPPAEIAVAIAPLADRLPQLVRASKALDPRLGVPRLVVVPADGELDAKRSYYLRSVRALARTIEAYGVGLEGSRIVEIGCGTGYATYAAAALGAADAVGLDRDLEGYYEAVAERDALRDRLLGESAAGRARLVEADAAGIPLADASADAVVSFSVLEHLQRIEEAFAEMRRVLRPGGIAYHIVDPWFSPQGGHSMCTLDLPWGHVRLSPPEIEDYLEQHRPHERDAAVSFYREGFQRPRLTAGDLQKLVLDTGFELLRWDESSDAYLDHLPLLDAGIVEECAAQHPHVTPRDLLVHSIRLVARRR